MPTDRSEPTTAAGRALLNDDACWDKPVLTDAILAIEAEARQPDSLVSADMLAAAFHDTSTRLFDSTRCGPDSTGCRQAHRMDATRILAALQDKAVSR